MINLIANVFPLIGDAGLGAGVGAGLAAIAAGIGIGQIGTGMVRGISSTNDPEVRKTIQGMGLISAALVEGVCLFAVVICFLIQNEIR